MQRSQTDLADVSRRGVVSENVPPDAMRKEQTVADIKQTSLPPPPVPLLTQPSRFNMG